MGRVFGYTSVGDGVWPRILTIYANTFGQQSGFLSEDLGAEDRSILTAFSK